MRQRKGEKLVEADEGEKEPKNGKKKSQSRDPLRWFGLMPPSSLRRAQVVFTRDFLDPNI